MDLSQFGPFIRLEKSSFPDSVQALEEWFIFDKRANRQALFDTFGHQFCRLALYTLDPTYIMTNALYVDYITLVFSKAHNVTITHCTEKGLIVTPCEGHLIGFAFLNLEVCSLPSTITHWNGSEYLNMNASSLKSLSVDEKVSKRTNHVVAHLSAFATSLQGLGDRVLKVQKQLADVHKLDSKMFFIEAVKPLDQHYYPERGFYPASDPIFKLDPTDKSSLVAMGSKVDFGGHCNGFEGLQLISSSDVTLTKESRQSMALTHSIPFEEEAAVMIHLKDFLKTYKDDDIALEMLRQLCRRLSLSPSEVSKLWSMRFRTIHSKCTDRRPPMTNESWFTTSTEEFLTNEYKKCLHEQYKNVLK
jgi:hypothetical protein